MNDEITEREIQNIIGEQQIIIYKLTREFNKLVLQSSGWKAELDKLKGEKK